MKKERKTGASHYKENLGLKAILVYVDANVHGKLMRFAKKEGQSMQKTIRQILTKFRP